MTAEAGGDGRRRTDDRLPGQDARAAQQLLAGDGRGYSLQPWQVAYLFALVEGRPGVVPPGCGVGKGWLESRLREAREVG